MLEQGADRQDQNSKCGTNSSSNNGFKGNQKIDNAGKQKVVAHLYSVLEQTM